MSDSEQRRVLVIGKHSYIGRSLNQYCADMELMADSKDSESIVIDSISGKEQEWISQDFHGYDTVLLLSGIAHVKADPSLYRKVNYEMAVQIAQKAKQAQVKQFIFMSTIGVFGNRIEIQKDGLVFNPQTEYARTKKMAEDEILQMENGSFHTAIVRPPIVYGKNCPGNFTRLLHMIQKVHVFPTFRNERSTIYIGNLCEFLRRLILRQCGGCYVPQNPDYLCSSDLARAVRETGNSRVLMLHGLNWLVSIGTRANSQLNKIFGDYQFPLELSIYDDIPYQTYDTVESLKQSV